MGDRTAFATGTRQTRMYLARDGAVMDTSGRALLGSPPPTQAFGEVSTATTVRGYTGEDEC
jgi:hypothetical protein